MDYLHNVYTWQPRLWTSFQYTISTWKGAAFLDSSSCSLIDFCSFWTKQADQHCIVSQAFMAEVNASSWLSECYCRVACVQAGWYRRWWKDSRWEGWVSRTFSECSVMSVKQLRSCTTVSLQSSIETSRYSLTCSLIPRSHHVGLGAVE